MSFIPAFDWHRVIVAPWTADFSFTLWVALMGFLVTAACGLVGNYLLLRRMVFFGDAISHSILPGLVVAFMVFKHAGVWTSLLGAILAGFATVVLIEFIHKQSRIKSDAAICISFTTLFALGVALMSQLERHGSLHIDAECVLYGEIAFVPLQPPILWRGMELGPPAVWQMGLVFLVIVAAICLFYKELLVTSFDAGLARSLGISTTFWHYALMATLSMVIVSVFESVGAILPIAMLIVPPMFARQLSERLPMCFVLTVLHSAIAAVLGLHLSIWLNCSTAGAMVVASSGLFVLAWLWSQIRGRIRLRNALKK